MTTTPLRVAGLALALAAAALAAPGAPLAQHAGHGAEAATPETRPSMMETMRQRMAGMHGAAAGHDHGHGQGEGHGDHGHRAGAAADEVASTRAFREANRAMHDAMEIEFTGDADIDFARGMIGHHEGAIDMARIVLEHGEDEALRALAEEIIATQEAEIAFLRAWLDEHAD
jgi:uncharacterized protein (DUF305 family)